jgi:hypothetical protein
MTGSQGTSRASMPILDLVSTGPFPPPVPQALLPGPPPSPSPDLRLAPPVARPPQSPSPAPGPDSDHPDAIRVCGTRAARKTAAGGGLVVAECVGAPIKPDTPYVALLTQKHIISVAGVFIVTRVGTAIRADSSESHTQRFPYKGASRSGAVSQSITWGMA